MKKMSKLTNDGKSRNSYGKAKVEAASNSNANAVVDDVPDPKTDCAAPITRLNTWADIEKALTQ